MAGLIEDWLGRQADSAGVSPAVLAPAASNWKRLERKTDKQDFVDAVKSRGETMADAEVGHRTTSLCHLGHIAIQLGRKLQWDPAKEIFPGDSEANAYIARPILQPRRA